MQLPRHDGARPSPHRDEGVAGILGERDIEYTVRVVEGRGRMCSRSACSRGLLCDRFQAMLGSFLMSTCTPICRDSLRRKIGFDSLWDSRPKKILGTPFAGKAFDSLWGVATWEDMIDVAFDYQKPWHFSDKPVVLGDGCKMNDTAAVWSGFTQAAALEATHEQSRTNGKRPTHGEKKTYPQDVIFGLIHAFFGVTDNVSKWGDPALHQFQRAFWLRSLIHFVGDIHQPLHASTGCDARHPHGDRGGNAFKIQTDIVNVFENRKTKVAELHLLWDLGGGKYAKGPNWPLDDEAEVWLAGEAQVEGGGRARSADITIMVVVPLSEEQ